MLSNRPTVSAADTGGPIGSSTASIGNYKGVMLCNRPFAGAGGAAVKSGGNGNGGGGNSGGPASGRSFIAGTIEVALGANVSITGDPALSAKDLKDVKRSSSKKDSVLSKHREWLADLQRTKDKLQEEYLQEVEGKEKSRERFMDREAKMRAMVRGTLHPDRAESDEEEGDSAPSPERAAQRKRPEGKPAWALTEAKAMEAADDRLEDDVDNLLDFATDLDFDKYADDMELRVLIDQVKGRITKLEIERNQEDKSADDLDGERAQRAALRLKLEEMDAYDRDEAKDEEDDEAREAREAKEIGSVVRAENSTMREVHSQKSMEALVISRKAKGPGKAADSADFEKGVEAPKIITHKEDGGQRVEGKNDVSKLPYMNRNPAV